MIVKLLTIHHLKFLGLKGGYRGSSESTLVKMSNCWKSHALVHIVVTCSQRKQPFDYESENQRKLIIFLIRKLSSSFISLFVAMTVVYN